MSRAGFQDNFQKMAQDEKRHSGGHDAHRKAAALILFRSADSRGLMWLRAPALVHALLSAIGSALRSLLIAPPLSG